MSSRSEHATSQCNTEPDALAGPEDDASWCPSLLKDFPAVLPGAARRKEQFILI